ncbi:MAG: glutathione S-transferase family protein [Thermoleophilaceae bacterium]
MAGQPDLVLHVIPFSPPCEAVKVALGRKGLEYETVGLTPGPHADEVERVYGEGRRTVPGLLIDGEPVHGSIAIHERLEAMLPQPPLYPEPIADAVRAAERWGDGELQPAMRRMFWGTMHFRPEALGTFGGPGSLDPAGVDFAIKLLRATWRYIGITAETVAADIAALPAQVDRVDELVADGILGGEDPTAADLQIGASLQLLLTLGDLRPLIAGRPAESVAQRWFGSHPGDVPAGALPAGWVPAATATA